MAKRITTLSNKYKTRQNDRLDSDRYSFLDITQAEPNPGNPDSDGMLFTSLTSGVRSWTNNLLIRKLNFIAGALDSAGENDYYALVVKGNPFDGFADSIGVKNLSSLTGGISEEFDTLDTVTTRGNTTTNDITIGALIADSATFNFDVVIQGDLTVNGTTTTINTQDLVVEDKNILIASGSIDSATANNSGITVDGSFASILYQYDSDAWHFNKLGVFENGLKSLSYSTFYDYVEFFNDVNITGTLYAQDIDAVSLTANRLTIYDSAVLSEDVFLGAVPIATSNWGLFLENDGRITQKEITIPEVPVYSGIASQLIVTPTDSDDVFYPLFMSTLTTNDSVKADYDFQYNASTNRLTIGKLSLLEIIEQPSAQNVLTIQNDSVGFRDINDIIAAVVEYDTLDTVTTRGNTTTNSITVGNIDANIANFDSTTVSGNLKFTQSLLDNNDRRLLIYDSTGTIIWGA